MSLRTCSVIRSSSAGTFLYNFRTTDSPSFRHMFLTGYYIGQFYLMDFAYALD